MGRPSFAIDHGASVLSAARLMRQSGTPYVVVTDGAGSAVPLGTLSAQDIVARVLAVELDPSVLTVGDVLSTKAGPALDALLRRLAQAR
jgi:CBS domain-containing protein